MSTMGWGWGWAGEARGREALGIQMGLTSSLRQSLGIASNHILKVSVIAAKKGVCVGRGGGAIYGFLLGGVQEYSQM